MHNTRLMAHLVAGYPDNDTAIAVADALIQGGAKILEIQLPFSDPSADGPAIQTACSQVLERKYTVREGFDFIHQIHIKHPDTPIFLMTYASLAYTPGIKQFVHNAKEAGVSGLIIPDLPFDCDEGLGRACSAAGISHVPVAAPSMSKERIVRLTSVGYEYMYAALRAGITGTDTSITEDSLAFLKELSAGKTKILGGFGISSGKQAALLTPHVYAVVAGSVFVRIITETYDKKSIPSSRKELSEKLKQKAAEISGRI